MPQKGKKITKGEFEKNKRFPKTHRNVVNGFLNKFKREISVVREPSVEIPISEKSSLVHQRIFSLCDTIRECAFSLHKFLRNGHMEKVYERGMANRLRKEGLKVDQQFSMNAFDADGTNLWTFLPALLVESILIVEIKACKSIADEHIAQLLGYLRACKFKHGILINFGSSKLEIKKMVL